MGLPYVTLNEQGAAQWKKLLIDAGYGVQLDEEENRRCEELGSSCEPIDHPTLLSEYPYTISCNDSAQRLMCLEIAQRNKAQNLTSQERIVGLVFIPHSREEGKLVDSICDVLSAAGVVEELRK